MKLTIAGKTVEVSSVDELVASGVVERPVDIFLFRHDSAVLDVNDLEQLMGYCYGDYNPGLKEKGVNSAKATAERVKGFVDGGWYSSPSRRAQETAKILAGQAYVHVNDELRPANYYGVPEAAIVLYQKDAVAGDPNADPKLSAVYVGTGAHIKDQETMVQFVMGTSVSTAGAGGYVSHDEKCRLMMAFVLELPAERLIDDYCRIERGGYAEVNIRPDGKVSVTKVSADGTIEKLR